MKLIPNGVSRSVAMAILRTKKNSPHIFFGAGIAGVVGSTVLACKATLKLEKTVDEIKMDLDNVKVHKDVVDLDEREYYKDLGRVYASSALKVTRLYGPSILLGSASIACLTGSHIQMTRRNSALTATLAAVSKAYDDYRQRIQEELGEKREHELYHGITTEKNDKGKNVKVVNPTGYSIYARIFDETNPNWVKDVEHNRVFLKAQQTYMNHLLQSRGHVLLNDVYDMLGFDRTSAGTVVGWVRDGDGDGFVDFGLFEAAATRFINGLERSVILDFNVDGIVFEKI